MNRSNTGSIHLLIMLACCLIPLALILAIGVFGITLGSLTPLLPYAMVLLCPLMMFLMMRSMGQDHDMEHDHHANVNPSRSLATRLESNQESAKWSETSAGQALAGQKRCH